MDIDHIKNRVIEFLRNENITSAQFAQEIGVQPSGISHIISGRNKPSLDFILKMLTRYPSLSSEWLIFGKGSMFKTGSAEELFSLTESKPGQSPGLFSETRKINQEKTSDNTDDKPVSPVKKESAVNAETSETSRIVIFFRDGRFEEYFPNS